MMKLSEQVALMEAKVRGMQKGRERKNALIELLIDALEHCGYNPDDCIDCGGPPHEETCRFWKLRNILSYWQDEDLTHDKEDLRDE